MFQIPLELLQKIHFALKSSFGSKGVTVGESGDICDQLQRLQPIQAPPKPDEAAVEPITADPEIVVAENDAAK